MNTLKLAQYFRSLFMFTLEFVIKILSLISISFNFNLFQRLLEEARKTFGTKRTKERDYVHEMEQTEKKLKVRQYYFMIFFSNIVIKIISKLTRSAFACKSVNFLQLAAITIS